MAHARSGWLGEVARALLDAARTEPGTAVQLSQRARVGVGRGRYTVSRMLARGQLVVCVAGRPAILAAPPADAPADTPAVDRTRTEARRLEALVELDRALFGRPLR